MSEMNDTDNSDEEDGLILEGSELHKYLKKCQIEKVNVYKNSNGIQNVTQCYQKNENGHMKLASEESLKLTHMLLNSNLLLEEDASYLYKVFSEFETENEFCMYSIKFISGVFIVIMVLYIVYFNIYNWRWIFLIISTTLLTFIIYLYTHSRNKKRLKKLIDVLHETFGFVGKVIKIIIEDDKLLESKETFENLNRGHEQLCEVYNYRMKMSEVNLLCFNAILSLKHLIRISQNTTISIIKMEKQNGLKKYEYIAFYSDEQLGLNTPTTSEFDCQNLSTLNTLKNIHLLMQSECLRVFGLTLLRSPHCSYSRLFEIVSSYTKGTKSVLHSLQVQYRTYFSPLYLPLEKNNFKIKKSEKLNWFHDLSQSVKNVLLDIRKVEDYFETNDDHSSVLYHNFITSSLTIIENELMTLLESVRCFRTLFLDQSSTKHSKIENVSLKNKETSNPKINRVTVGISDFSVNGIDEVYMGCSDFDATLENENLLDVDDHLKPPASLIVELKTALKQKRSEFEEREIKALKNVHDIEAYKACSNTVPISLCQKVVTIQPSTKNIKDDIRNEHSEYCNMSSLYHEKPFESISQLELSRDIAIAASKISVGWNEIKAFEYFGNDIND